MPKKCIKKKEQSKLCTMYVLYTSKHTIGALDKYESNSRHALVQHTTHQKMSGVIMGREGRLQQTGMEDQYYDGAHPRKLKHPASINFC